MRLSARHIGGFAAAVLTAFFLVHAVLGALSLHLPIDGRGRVLVWAGVVLAAVHIAICVVTSVQMLSDMERPPSARKRSHLVLKWVTGLLLAVVALAHVVLPVGIAEGLLAVGSMVLLAAAIGLHACVGAKSLLKDIGVDRQMRMPFRVAVCLVLAASAVAVLGALV